MRFTKGIGVNLCTCFWNRFLRLQDFVHCTIGDCICTERQETKLHYCSPEPELRRDGNNRNMLVLYSHPAWQNKRSSPMNVMELEGPLQQGGGRFQSKSTTLSIRLLPPSATWQATVPSGCCRRRKSRGTPSALLRDQLHLPTT